MINLHESMGPGRSRTGSAVVLTTNCVKWPGTKKALDQMYVSVCALIWVKCIINRRPPGCDLVSVLRTKKLKDTKSYCTLSLHPNRWVMSSRANLFQTSIKGDMGLHCLHRPY